MEEYDEFGNYIGPSSDEESSQDEEVEQPWDEPEEASEEEAVLDGQIEPEEPTESAIVLHEDKKYYPTSEEVYGETVETVLQEEDTQPLEVPVITPKREVLHHCVDLTPPETTYDKDYMLNVATQPNRVRTLTLAGPLHSGKTALVDMLWQETHHVDVPLNKEIRYTDTRLDEQARKISLKSTPFTMLLPDMKDVHYCLHLLDTPGHVNFSDEFVASAAMSDGVILVVDAVEGVNPSVEAIIRHCCLNDLELILFINKVDRIITELKFPPADAYHKLHHTINDVNVCLERYSHGEKRYVSPVQGTVLFGSARSGWMFSLASWCDMLAEKQKHDVDVDYLIPRMWGNVYYHEKAENNQRFKRQPEMSGDPRTFVQFVLTPIYKLYSACVGEPEKTVEKMLVELGIRVRNKTLALDSLPLIKTCFNAWLGNPGCLVSACVKFIPSPLKYAATKLKRDYTGRTDSDVFEAMMKCDPSGPLMIHCTKVIPRSDAASFYALGRVMSGTLSRHHHVRVLGEQFTLEDDEDSAFADASNLSYACGRYQLPAESVTPGNICLIEGVDSSIAKTVTIVDANLADAFIFRPLTYFNKAVCKIAIEPLSPGELPKMVEGLRALNKTYPLLHTKVEESGEHVVLGTGELYLDCAMSDLRQLYANCEIKIADPSVAFCESVTETSAMMCFSKSPNDKNKLTMLSEPLEKGLGEDIENGQIRPTEWPKKQVSEFLRTKYDWDHLASRRLWAFGPDSMGPNVFVNDTLPNETDQELVNDVKESVVQGFQWATREGPLCDEPVRGCKFRLVDANICGDKIGRGGNQIVPTARRAVYSSFLLAQPRLLEPYFVSDITVTADAASAVHDVLNRRRGHVVQEGPISGSPLTMMRAYIPVMDSYGFETDLRVHSQGAAFCQSVFDHWQVVPGDPLDKSIELIPLQPAPPNHLARDFMLKTRRRKGLSEDVTIAKFFDDEMLIELSQREADLF